MMIDVLQWPTLNTASLLQNKMLLKRAHMVLAWLAHFYVHSMPKSPDSEVKRIPSSIAVPLVQISGVLKTAPALTFADTVLWNLEPIHQNVSFSIDNCRVVNCFSGTEDERNFYRVSAQVEFRGTEALSIINRYLRITDHSDGSSHHALARDLTRLTEIIEDFVELLKSLRELVEPKVFYWAVRPWYKGSGDNGTAWELEGVSGFETLELSGPSAGQSSVMHAIDAFLDIDHKLVYSRCPIPSVKNLQADLGFMERMRRYMPGQHQDFLSCIDQAPSLRELAQRKASLRDPYNKAVDALKRLRDLHIRFVCLCIVSMANSSPPPGIIVNQEEFGCKADAIRGTSGSNVSTLLKAGRDSTRRAMIESK
jgi:indoleamine 2,3-dioxygenase